MEENKKIDFEASLKQLEEIVNKIENQTLPLDESIALYEQGKTIIDQLETALKEAEEKINKLAIALTSNSEEASKKILSNDK